LGGSSGTVSVSFLALVFVSWVSGLRLIGSLACVKKS
jgi:hypothetical protein